MRFLGLQQSHESRVCLSNDEELMIGPLKQIRSPDSDVQDVKFRLRRRDKSARRYIGLRKQ